jgi:hypothetical protein
MRTSLILTLALAALALPLAAAAKGPDAATLSGPGIDGSLPVTGAGEGGPGTPLGDLVQYGGFFPQMFGESPDPTTRARPAGELGPRYSVVYSVPGPNGRDAIRQDLYPYATPAPVSYIRPGISFWDGQRTHGGWYAADPALLGSLTKIGLPASPPAVGGSHVWRWTGVGLAALAAVAALLLLLRRRPRPEPARA